MKYVILIHSNPQPWGHPTTDFIPEYKALPEEKKKQLAADFDKLLEELQSNGEWVTAAALADPASSTLYRRPAGEQVVTDGPYSEAKEHFAGFFMIDVESRERAEQIASRFGGPTETIELRPVAE
ncbi:MAG: hypothetical protein J2O46_03930, partial [Nocardioides sp.]|nr:hypothetical protein [Nocardioides sp.]